jgi:cytochrome bd-type quinol oxidase subunit 2
MLTPEEYLAEKEKDRKQAVKLAWFSFALGSLTGAFALAGALGGEFLKGVETRHPEQGRYVLQTASTPFATGTRMALFLFDPQTGDTWYNNPTKTGGVDAYREYAQEV